MVYCLLLVAVPGLRTRGNLGRVLVVLVKLLLDSVQ